MSKQEQETHIIINKADLDEGYFIFSTSIRLDYLRFLRRIGGVDKLIDVRESTSKDGVTEWVCRVPRGYYSPSSFRIKIHGSMGRFRPRIVRKSQDETAMEEIPTDAELF